MFIAEYCTVKCRSWRALCTLCTIWWGHSVNILPNEQIVCQLDKWIIVLDPDTRQMAVISRGLSPVVLPDGPATRPSTRASSAPTTKGAD